MLLIYQYNYWSVVNMRNIGIRYYKMGLYTNEQFALFVKRGYVTPEEYLEMTGVEYNEETAKA